VSARTTRERVARERARVSAARRALASHVDPLARAAGRIHPLVLVGTALAAGLVAGRLIPRPRLPRGLEPARLVSSALEKSLVAGIQLLLSSAFARAPVSDGSTAGSRPETRSRAP
jgi:hypothetical protein